MGNPKNHALLGTVGKPPLWTQDGFRPVLGTTIDSRIAPGPLSPKEESLLLSRWWPARDETQLASWQTVLKGHDLSHSHGLVWLVSLTGPRWSSPRPAI